MPQERQRLRWRARRGLLENDLLLERFFQRYENDLNHEEVIALSALLELDDNDLLDILLLRKKIEFYANFSTPAESESKPVVTRQHNQQATSEKQQSDVDHASPLSKRGSDVSPVQFENVPGSSTDKVIRMKWDWNVQDTQGMTTLLAKFQSILKF
jgi:antitoxin CptB